MATVAVAHNTEIGCQNVVGYPLNLEAFEGFFHSRAFRFPHLAGTVASTPPAPLSMSASGANCGAGAGDGSGERGRPLGGLVGMPPIPRKRGCPRGSRNKKTLAALATAAAAASGSLRIGRSSSIAAAPGGTVAAGASGAAASTAATSIAGLTGTPLQAAAALVGAAMAFRAAPPGLAGLDVGGSSSAVTGKARKAPPRPPTRQRLSYVPVHGFATALVPLLAGSNECLPLPASFVGTMGKSPPTSFMIEDGSGG
jgi:hypothetical protein